MVVEKSVFSRPYWEYGRAYGTMFCPSVVCLSVTFCIVAKRYVVEGWRWYRWIGALVSSYRLSIVTMSLTAAVWPQFATHVFRGGIGRLTCIGSDVNKQVTTFTFRAQATTCSKHHTRTIMGAGCECAPWVRSANPSDSWSLFATLYVTCHARKRFLVVTLMAAGFAILSHYFGCLTACIYAVDEHCRRKYICDLGLGGYVFIILLSDGWPYNVHKQNYWENFERI